jgi:hypothetical protein
MRICFLITAFLFFPKIFFFPCAASYEKFVDSKGDVTNPILLCLNLTGIYVKGQPQKRGDFPKPVLTINSRKLKDIVKIIQGIENPKISWIMKGKRWEMYNPLLTPEAAKKILKVGLQDLGFKKSIGAQKKNYKGILLLGSLAERFNERIFFTEKLLQKGIKFNKFYILTGQRSLENFEKEEFSFLKDIDDEGEMTLAFFKKILSPKLEGKYIYVYSNAPPESSRATTESTVQEFMKYTPEPGVYLAISNGCFIPYQELVIQNCLDKNYPTSGIKVECVGSGDKTSIEGTERELINKASIFLDSLARILNNLQIQHELN